MKTAIAAPAPRPSDEEMLAAIERLPVKELARLIIRLRILVWRRLGDDLRI